MFAIGNGENDNQPICPDGEWIACRHCGRRHKATYAKNENGNKTDLVIGRTCTKTTETYLIGFAGRLLPGERFWERSQK